MRERNPNNNNDAKAGGDASGASGAPGAPIPSRWRRHWHRPLRHCAHAIAVLLGGLVVLVAVLAFRVSQGPIALNFLSPTIVQALKGLDPEADVTIGETVVLWSESRRTVQLEARDVRIHGPNGEDRASVPELAVSLSMPALLHGLLAPSGLEIYGLHVTLVRGPDGKIQFGDFAPPPEEAGAQQAELSGNAIETLLSMFAGPPDPSVRSSYLKRASVINASFTLDDRKTGHIWRAPEAHLSIVRDAQGAEGRIALALDLAGAKPRADVVVRYRPGDDAVTADAVIRDLAPTAVAAAADDPEFAPLGALDALVTARVRGAIGLDGTIRGIGFQADVGAGRLIFNRAGLGGDDTGVPLAGARVEVDMSEALDRLTIRRLDLDIENGAKLAITGDATLDDVPVVHFAVNSPGLPVATLVRYWPPGVAHNARNWLAKNLEAGVGEDARFSGELGPVGPDRKFDVRSLDGAFRYRDISVAYFRPLPSATQVSGTATMTADTLTFNVVSGRVNDLRITGATVKVTGLDVHDQDVAVEATADGPLTTVFGILDNPRLGFISKAGIDPKSVTGDTATRMRIAMPLEDDIPFDQVKLQVNSNFSGVTIPKVALGLDVVDATGTVVADGKGMAVTAKAKVAGKDTDFSLNENFDGGPGYKRRLWVRGTLDDAARNTLGISLAPYVTGPTGVEATIVQPDERRTDIEAVADLTPATVTFSDFGWGKDPDERGTAALHATLRDDKIASIDLLEVRSGDLVATGQVAFAPDGKDMTTATFPRIAFGETDIRVEAQRSPTTGTYMIRVGGPKLNVEPLIDVSSDDGEKDGAPMIVDVAVGTARLGEGGAVHGLGAHLERNTKRWNLMTIDAAVGDQSRPIAVRMRPDGNGRTLTVTSADAGATNAALDITSHVRGGTISFNGRYDDSDPRSPLKGKLEIRDFRLANAPVMAKVLSVASFTGIVDALRGQGIDFSRFDANVTFVGGSVYTDDLLCHGSALGFTSKGNINLRDKTLDLQGTIVPAYSLNSVLGNIPLLGPIIAQGGGVFAANYRMRGAVDNPDVTVNPLSTLAPGFLRNLFNVFQSPAQSSPSEAAPQTPAPAPAPAPSGR